jgi:hypothetical protein
MAKGWLDNYGKQENYNDFKVSAPEGFVGEGYSNVGRNYSPAWGVSFKWVVLYQEQQDICMLG